MNTQQGQLSDDSTTLILMGLLFGPAVLAAGLGFAASKVPGVAGWLVEHHVLAAAADDPFLVIPGTGGAGLDLMRIIPVVALLLIVLVWAVWVSKRVQAAAEEKGARK